MDREIANKNTLRKIMQKVSLEVQRVLVRWCDFDPSFLEAVEAIETDEGYDADDVRQWLAAYKYWLPLLKGQREQPPFERQPPLGRLTYGIDELDQLHSIGLPVPEQWMESIEDMLGHIRQALEEIE